MKFTLNYVTHLWVSVTQSYRYRLTYQISQFKITINLIYETFTNYLVIFITNFIAIGSSNETTSEKVRTRKGKFVTLILQIMKTI